jgi:hypothetical protein
MRWTQCLPLMYLHLLLQRPHLLRLRLPDSIHFHPNFPVLRYQQNPSNFDLHRLHPIQTYRCDWVLRMFRLPRLPTQLLSSICWNPLPELQMLHRLRPEVLHCSPRFLLLPRSLCMMLLRG